jgi:ketosteroid isomerase-like protein
VSTATADLVRQLLALTGDGDLEAAAALFADDVDFAVPGAPDLPWVPKANSADGMLEFFRRLPQYLESRRFAVDKILADEEDAMVLGDLVSTVRATGRDIVTRFVIHLSVRDGKFTRYHLYEDSWAVAQAVA